MVGPEARQWLALIYLWDTILRWFPSREGFLCWCESLAYLVMSVALVPSSPGAEKKKERKKCLWKKASLSTKEEPVREEGTDLQAMIAPEEGISVAAEGSRSTGLISAELHSSPKSLSGPLFLEGASQVIDLEEEGGPIPSLVFGGKLRFFASEGSELETTEGDASLLRKQVALLKSREVKLLHECEVAQAKVVWLREELEAS
ncbi:hypothetical protein ACLOJK_026677, partial [Asimina triloba]